MSSEAPAPKKRGRPAKPTESVKRHSIGFTTHQALRDQIKDAANKTGQSVALEIEKRLERSFLVEQEMERLTGATPETTLLIQAVQFIINRVERETGGKWHEDWPTFAAMRAAIVGFINDNSPRVGVELPQEVTDALEHANAAQRVAQEAKDALDAFDAEHPEAGPLAMPVNGPKGLFGSSMLGKVIINDPEAEEGFRTVDPPTAEILAARGELLSAWIAASNRAMEASTAYSVAVQPILNQRERQIDIGKAITASVAPLFRIVPR